MNKIHALLFGFLFIGASISVAQPYASWTKTELKLNNGLVQRTINLPAEKGIFVTTSYKPVSGEFKYFVPSSGDF